MYVTKDKKLAINTDLIQAVRVGADDGVTIATANNAFTLSGDDAEAALKQFGLTSHADDAKEAAAKKEPENHPAHQQPTKK